MQRRKFISVGVIAAAAIALSSTFAVGFGLPKIPGLGGGSSGGGGWGSIAKEAKESLGVIASQSPLMLSAIADLVKAAGFENEARVLKAEADKLDKTGGVTSETMVTVKSKTTGALDLVAEKMKSSKKLTVEQKKEMAKALSKYVPAAVKGLVAAVKLSITATKAGGAGAPGMSDGMEVLSLAKDLPTLGPAAASWVADTVSASNTFLELAEEKGIAVPEKIDIKM
jgi:ElaB/YqjD/DUF883 family membrane-anchored ribosome-binding protein